jgi:hypothetical protein
MKYLAYIIIFLIISPCVVFGSVTISNDLIKYDTIDISPNERELLLIVPNSYYSRLKQNRKIEKPYYIKFIAKFNGEPPFTSYMFFCNKIGSNNAENITKEFIKANIQEENFNAKLKKIRS